MRLLEVHTVPVWEELDGSRRLGLEEEADHPPVVGWANVLVLTLAGRTLKLLAVEAE